MMNMIKGYRQEMDFVNAGAGTATWCIASKDGKRYFIKSFLEVTLIDEQMAGNLPVEMVEAKRKSCVQFRMRKERLYSKLNEIQNGVFVSPIELIIYNGHFCAVTEYIESFSDSENIYKFSPRRKAILMRTLVLAMRDLSNSRIVHSDIKPDNIVITYNRKKIPQLKLIDFDSGFFEDEPPRNVNEYHGDMVYFAPESMIFMQSEGEADVPLTCAADRFAMGLLLHEMWCGMLPEYDREECSNVAEARLMEKPVTLHASIPAQLSEVINSFLQTDPEERMSYDRAYELLGDYLSTLPEEPEIEPEPESEPEPRPKPLPKPEPKIAKVRVQYVDTEGHVLESDLIEIAPGKRLTVKPKNIDGYKCTDGPREISVDATGRVTTGSVEFIYRKKKHSVLLGLIIAAVIALLWSAFTMGSAKAAVHNENWADAGRYISLCPVYDVLFPQEALEIHYQYGLFLCGQKDYGRAARQFAYAASHPDSMDYMVSCYKYMEDNKD